MTAKKKTTKKRPARLVSIQYAPPLSAELHTLLADCREALRDGRLKLREEMYDRVTAFLNKNA